MCTKRQFIIIFTLLAALTLSSLAPGVAEEQLVEDVPFIIGYINGDTIAFIGSAASVMVNYKIYDQMGGNVLWEGEQFADEGGYSAFSIFDTHVDLNPGAYIVVSDGYTTKYLTIVPISIDLFDLETNILAGTTTPDSFVFVLVYAEGFSCGADAVTNASGEWMIDFDDYGCDVTEDMGAYAQIKDADGDISEAQLDAIWGSHDFNQGDLPASECVVGGWAVDTDDRERDVHIRIWAGDQLVVPNVVADLPVNNFGVCGLEGSCGYAENLWGLIEPNVTYVINVDGYDLETGLWKPLGHIPRELTCRTQDIYTFDPETGDTERINELDATNEHNPSWSPNGKYLAFDVVTLENVQTGVYITNLNTGQTYPLNGAQDGGNDADWSPNGKMIVFDREPVGDLSLYLVPSSGGTAKLLSSDAVRGDFSPNGKRVAFRQPSDGSIRTIAIDGKGGETIVAASGSNPAWSPDGHWIAYNDNGDIWKIRVDSKGLPVGNPIQLTNTAFDEYHPAWSPDGSSIVFHSFMFADADIWTVSADGALPTWLTGAKYYGDYAPTYASNSSRMAYSSFSPNGQAPRDWVAYFTYDMEPGYWSLGEHSYQFWSLGIPGGEPIQFSVSTSEPIYDGEVLLRPYSLRARVGEELLYIDALNPTQDTLFHVGWRTNETYTYTYADAVEYFDTIMAHVSWDDGLPIDMSRHEIFPLNLDVNRDPYFIFFTYD